MLLGSFGWERSLQPFALTGKAAVGTFVNAGSITDNDIVVACFPLPRWVLVFGAQPPLLMQCGLHAVLQGCLRAMESYKRCAVCLSPASRC